MCKGAEAVNSMATPDSSDSENDIDLTTLKGLFTVTEKVDLLALSELSNSDVKLQGSDTTHTVRSLEMFNRKLKIENSSVKRLIDTGLSVNILNQKTFDKIKEESKGNQLLQKTNVKVIAYGENQLSLQLKDEVSLVVEGKSRITTSDFYIINAEHRNLLAGETALQLNILSIP